MKPLFQVAFDVTSVRKALKIALKIEKWVDVIEVGTPLLKSEGIAAVKLLKEKFPQKLIMADTKTMDTGALEAKLVFEAGADLMSVCATAPLTTIKEAIKMAKSMKKETLVDLIGIAKKAAWVGKYESLAPDYFHVHTGIDEQSQGADPLKDLKEVRKATQRPLSVAGGLTTETIPKVLRFRPKIVIVGGFITQAKDPRLAAKKIREIIDAL